jgi:hypothetical protein
VPLHGTGIHRQRLGDASERAIRVLDEIDKSVFPARIAGLPVGRKLSTVGVLLLLLGGRSRPALETRCSLAEKVQNRSAEKLQDEEVMQGMRGRPRLAEEAFEPPVFAVREGAPKSPQK